MQFGRRNLSVPEKFDLIEYKKEAMNNIGRNKISEIQKERHDPIFVKSDKVTNEVIDTRKVLAAEIGTSAGNFHKMETIKKSNPVLWE